MPAASQNNERLSQQEESSLIQRWKEKGSQSALNRLTAAHDAFCRQQAAKWHRSAPMIDIEDLRQEARLGLIEGIKHFDPDRGFRLLTYSVHWINRQLRDYVNNNRVIQTRPARMSAEDRDLLALYDKLMNEHGHVRPLTPNDVAKMEHKLGVKLSRAMEIKNAYFSTGLSLDTPLKNGGEESDTTMGDMLVDETANPFEEIQQGVDRRYLESLLSQLPANQESVIRERYLSSPDSDEMKTLEELATPRGVSRERIRQIEEEGLKRLFKAATVKARAVGEPVGSVADASSVDLGAAKTGPEYFCLTRGTGNERSVITGIIKDAERELSEIGFRLTQYKGRQIERSGLAYFVVKSMKNAFGAAAAPPPEIERKKNEILSEAAERLAGFELSFKPVPSIGAKPSIR